MRCPRRLPKTMLAAILAVGIAFPAPALAFADDAADANKSAGESAVDTTTISEGATQANDPALFDELVEGVDYRGLLVTLDEDSKINLLSADGGGKRGSRKGLPMRGPPSPIDRIRGRIDARRCRCGGRHARVGGRCRRPGSPRRRLRAAELRVQASGRGARRRAGRKRRKHRRRAGRRRRGHLGAGTWHAERRLRIHPRSERTLQPILALHHAHHKSVEPRAYGQHRHRSHTRHGRGFRPCGSGRQPAYGLRVGCVQQQAAERERA